MEAKEFKQLIEGLPAALVGRVTGRGAGQIAAYKGGHAPIPYDVVRTVQELVAYIAKLEAQNAKKVKRPAGFRCVVDGLVYDTSTATEIVASIWNGVPRNDFRSAEEALYRTRAGRFFLHGEGGAMTRWAKAAGDNSVTGGSGIQPLDEDEAKDWLLANERQAEYEALFGKLPEA